MWWMNPESQAQAMDSPYPERPGEPDCAYYMKTGLCAFGMDCRFNHPPDRTLTSGIDRSREDYPERIGQPECQYYLKTGICKFGSTCKYHHPRDKAGSAGRPAQRLNALNLPLRPAEKDCAFYMRTGTCKYGATCKFNHPQPVAGGAMPGSPLFPGGGIGSTLPAAQMYPGGFNAPWQVSQARPPLITSPRTPGQPSFPPMFLPAPQGLVQAVQSGWNAYPSPGHFVPFDVQQQASMQPTNYLYGAAPSPQDPLALSFPAAAAFSPYLAAGTSAVAFPMSPSSPSGPVETFYPERPGQPDCQYYMRTGECKFGSTCRYHHPKERNAGGIAFGPTGLPLRPGAPPCTFFARHGFCKFGPTCKFDHPLPAFPTVAEMPVLSPVPMSSGTARFQQPPRPRQQFPSRPEPENPGASATRDDVL